MKNKVGDLFVVTCGEFQKYFQYIGDDSSQLNSNVIRIFVGRFFEGNPVSLAELEASGVDIYAHVMLKVGEKLGYWKRKSAADAPPVNEVIFRDTNDYGNPSICVSSDWWVWAPNQPRRHVGRLSENLLGAHIGIVISPDQIVKRMCTGSFQFVYPSPE